MKKILILLPILTMANSAFAKVSYEDALESNRPYAEANAAVHNPPDTEGLTAAEFDPDAEAAEDTGHWVKVSSNPVKIVNAGDYATVLTPDAAGGACAKGTKGLIVATDQYCGHWNSGGTHCQGAWTTTLSDEGYKAECK
ncbi:hypothetical protein KB976_003980 [Vibrio parahaemolyticus]|nr:hypothetical protein [Vibrio parahaemolyticus]